MNWIDYVLIGVLALAVVGIIVYLIRQKKQGKTGCGCGCANCPSAGACHGAKPKQETAEAPQEEHIEENENI